MQKSTSRRVLTRAALVGGLLGGLALRGRGLRKAAGAYSAYAKKLHGLGGVKRAGMVRTTIAKSRAASFRARKLARMNRNVLRGLGVIGGGYTVAPLMARRKRAL